MKQTAPADSPPLASASTAAEGWTEVRQKKKKKPATAEQLMKERAKKKPRLRPPRSAAVSIKLQPSAAESGLSYAGVLMEFKRQVDFFSLGITDIRFKLAATGARMLELPGDKGEKADALAQWLESIVDPQMVKISKPTKCAELRVSGLDDSVTPEEMALAVSRVGGCPPANVKVGEVRRGRSGFGSAWVRCPILAAKQILKEGRLLVGFVSARVALLSLRPQRCYRCLEVGHVAASCQSAIDRSQQCFRCGKDGHKFSQCERSPH